MTNHFQGPGYVPGHAEAQAEADRRAKTGATKAPQLSSEAIAIKKALGVPLVDRTDEARQAYRDKQAVEGALRSAAYGGNYGSRAIDNVIADIGVDRFLAAAPPDVAAKMRAEIAKQRPRKTKAAAPKAAAPKAPRRFSTEEAIIIRMRGTQAQREALSRQEAAEHPDSCHCRSCENVKYHSRSRGAEGARELAALIKQHAPNASTAPGNKPTMSQAEISRTWQEAHAKVARETGRIGFH